MDMDMERVQFATGHTWSLTKGTKYDLMIAKLFELIGCGVSNMFPGAHPVSIERKHFADLKERPYWVCAKSDGLRFIFACITVDDVNYSFFINRKNNIFLIDCLNVESVYKGTILDGEMIFNFNTESFEFAVYDCIMACGEMTTEYPHSERMSRASHVLEGIRNNNDIKFFCKRFYPLSEIEYYTRHVMKYLEHRTDGLIFTPEFCPIKNGTNYKMFKWKECLDNTVDFAVSLNTKSSNPKYTLKILKGKYLSALFDQLLHVNEDLDGQIMRSLNSGQPCIIECKYVTDGNWKGEKIRHDKTYPNNVVTFGKTLVNIKENIGVSEFYK